MRFEYRKPGEPGHAGDCFVANEDDCFVWAKKIPEKEIGMTELSKIDSIINDPKELAALKSICAPQSSEAEYKLLLEMSKAMRLNPYLKEIEQIKMGGKTATIISRNGYRVIAQRQESYDYHYCEAFYEKDFFEVCNGLINHKYTNGSRGKLIGAYCVVKRRNSSREMNTVVYLDDFNKNNNNWLSMPEVMIKKVSEAHALRLAFASEFTGTYHESEKWADEDVPDKPVIESKPAVIALATKEQVTSITSLVVEVELAQNRLSKAMDYYGVKTYEELSFDNAEHFLQMLRNIRIEKMQARIDEELK